MSENKKRPFMKLAIASGKGGTGKTTLAVALALAFPGPVTLLDCDVEEPNGHLFLNAKPIDKKVVTVPVPEINEKSCIACGRCAENCRFNALAIAGKKVLVFPELCHSCGGCALSCPTGSINERKEPIGTIEKGIHKNITYIKGTLDVGKTMAPPVIRNVKKYISPSDMTIIDSPPGTACPLLTAVKDTDFVLLVTEPTPFGLHDLKMAVETMRAMKLPFGVVLNRAEKENGKIDEFCLQEKIPLMLKIPQSRKAAEAYSGGKSLLSAMPGIRLSLEFLMKKIEKQIKGVAL